MTGHRKPERKVSTARPDPVDRWVRRVARAIRLARCWALSDVAAAAHIAPVRLAELEAGTACTPEERRALTAALTHGCGPGDPIRTTGDLLDLLRLVPPDTPLAVALTVEGRDYVTTLDGAGLDRDGAWYLQVVHE